MLRLSFAVAAIVCSLALSVPAVAHQRHRHHGTGDKRALTIGGHRGVYRDGDRIVAPGGFSAQGYGYPVASPEDVRQARDAALRADGLGFGGPDVAVGLEPGFGNPYYGNGFNRYVGYGGVPSDLAFGPAFANRHRSGLDPLYDGPIAGPSPGDLGYAVAPRP